MIVGLLGNKSPDSNRFTLVAPKPANGVRLQATLGNQNPTDLPVGAVRLYLIKNKKNLFPVLFVFEGNKIKDIRRMDHEAEANYQTRQIKPIDVKLFSKETLKEKIARSEACLKLPEPR